MRLLLVVLCIFVESLQVLIIAAMLSNQFPCHSEPIISQSFSTWSANLKIDRQLQLYQLFVLTNIILAAAFVSWGYKNLKSQLWIKSVAAYTITQAFLVAIQLFAVFKIVVYKSPHWAMYLLDIGLGSAIVTKIFWPEVSGGLKDIYGRLRSNALPKPLVMRSFEALALFIILGLLCVPDLGKAFSRVFLWGRFLDWDRYLVGPGWAYLNGAHLNADALSPWGAVAPSLIAGLSKLFGGFDYIHIMACCMALVIIYLLGSYLFLRFWLGSVLLGLGGLLLIIKLQLFNASAAPLIWLYPQKTCLRYLPDLFVLTALVKFSQKNNGQWLWAACIGTGISLGYMIDTGFALLMAFYSYLIFLLIKSDLPKFVLVRFFVLPWLVALGLLGLVQGAGIADPHFWENTFEPAFRLSRGIGTIPFYDCLRSLQFFAFVMAFIIPGLYVMTILIIGALCYFDKIRRTHILAAVISIYGLGLYPYYLWRSSLDNYYAVGVPFVLVLCFWIKHSVDFVSPSARRMILIAWVVLNGAALLTNQLFIYYPNALNIAGYDWSSEKKLTQDNFDFTTDAKLIEENTSKDEMVVLVSSFETQILMQAGRRSFFKWVPLIDTMHMGQPQFGGTAMQTSGELQSTLQELEQSKPGRVFVEKKLILGQLPAQYYQYYQSLTVLMLYFRQHYALAAQGQYLLELKRK
jgi:hypothetical protein